MGTVSSAAAHPVACPPVLDQRWCSATIVMGESYPSLREGIAIPNRFTPTEPSPSAGKGQYYSVRDLRTEHVSLSLGGGRAIVLGTGLAMKAFLPFPHSGMEERPVISAPPVCTPTLTLPHQGGGGQATYGKSLGNICTEQYWGTVRVGARSTRHCSWPCSTWRHSGETPVGVRGGLTMKRSIGWSRYVAPLIVLGLVGLGFAEQPKSGGTL